MCDLSTLLKQHYDNHPAMTLQDGAKLLHQHFMGPGHLIPDEDYARTRLAEEWDALTPNPGTPLYESIENGLCRLNLSACKGKELSSDLIARLFFLTANSFKSNHSGLEDGLELLYALPFPKEEVSAFLAQYRREGCPALHHSEEYRRAYAPAYRVVSEYYVTLIPMLTAIRREMKNHSHLRLAIDGPCASGKSTLGRALADIFSCPLVAMDDFFLRPEQRTEEQLAQPGGNVDHQRFRDTVLSPLLRGESARYQPWQCRSGSFGAEITVPPAPLTVVEGSYTLRPDLREHYQLRIWVEAPWEVRRQRLLARCGEAGLARFEALWIPLENRYFDACRVKECCEIIYYGSIINVGVRVKTLTPNCFEKIVEHRDKIL